MLTIGPKLGAGCFSGCWLPPSRLPGGRSDEPPVTAWKVSKQLLFPPVSLHWLKIELKETFDLRKWTALVDLRFVEFSRDLMGLD